MVLFKCSKSFSRGFPLLFGRCVMFGPTSKGLKLGDWGFGCWGMKFVVLLNFRSPDL